MAVKTTHVLPISVFEETDFIPKQLKTSGRTAPVYMVLVRNSRFCTVTGVNSHRYDSYWYAGMILCAGIM